MRRLFVFALLLLWGAATAHAQIRIRVTVRNPAPTQLSAWQTDPGIVNIQITNQGAELAAVRLSGEIRAEDGRIVASTNDADPSIPRFALAGNGRTTRLTGRSVLSTSAVRIDRSISNIAAKTNSLPEGDYVFCVRLLTDAGEEIREAEEACGEVQIIIANPPQLVLPAEGQAVNNANVQFQWTPVPRGIVSGNVEYDIVVVPILGREQPEVAIKRNEKLLNRRERRYGYQMSSADRPLTANGARRFAWQVRAVTSDGIPCTSNDGYSEVGTFQIADQGEDLDASIDRVKPDTVIIRGHRVAITKWGRRNDDGSYSAQGCMIIKCDNRTRVPVSVSDHGKSSYRLPGQSMRQFTVRENITDSSTEVSVEQIRRSGGSFKPGDAISLPVNPTRQSGSRFNSGALTAAIQNAGKGNKDCFDVQLTNVRWQGEVKKAMQCTGTIVYARSDESTTIPILYPADSFVVEVDSVIIPHVGAVTCYGNLYHTSALIGDGTGELARLPVRWITLNDGDVCLRLARMEQATPVMWIGETGIAFSAVRYVINFSNAGAPSIAFERAQTVGPRDNNSIKSNSGYLLLGMTLEEAMLSKSGFSANAVARNLQGVSQQTSTPRRHQLYYNSIQLDIRNSRLRDGQVSVEVRPFPLQSTSQPWSNSFDRSSIDSNYTMLLAATDDPSRAPAGFSTQNRSNDGEFRFQGMTTTEKSVVARYPATATFPPPQFSVTEVQNPLAFMQRENLSGILFSHQARTKLTIQSSRDVNVASFGHDGFIDGIILLGAGGATGKLRYDAHKADGTRYVESDLNAGRLGSNIVSGGRFVSNLPNQQSDGKNRIPEYYFEFLHDVADTTHMVGQLLLPAPLNMQIDVPDMTVTALGDFPASAVKIDTAKRRANPWELEILPQDATQTDMGFVAFDRGVVNLTQSAFAERVHFDKPFNVHLIEFNAIGTVGAVKIDANSAGQKFDGFNYAPETVRLSTIPPQGDSAEFLGTTGFLSIPFFGAKYMHIIDARDADTSRPKLRRNVTVAKAQRDGFQASDLRFTRSDAMGLYDYAVEYDVVGQNGFLGKGIAQPHPLKPMNTNLLVNRFSTCFNGKELDINVKDFLETSLTFNELDDAWICGCVENDAIATYALGGAGQFNGELFPFVASANTGSEVTFGVKGDIVTVWSSGAAQLTLLSYANADARMLYRGVIDRGARYERGVTNLDATVADMQHGGTFAGELDLYTGNDPSSGSFMAYMQGKVRLTANVHRWIVGARGAAESGLFIGYQVPKQQAWVISATDSRFKLRDDFLTNSITGVYLYGLASAYVDALLVTGRVDVFAGIGTINLNVATSLGIDLHGSIFGGVLYGSALLNLQAVAGRDIGFYGRGTFQGCINTYIWEKSCTDVGIGVGLTNARGFYVE